MKPRIAFEFICPAGHKDLVSFDRDELKQSASKPFGHGVWCEACQKHYEPSHEWLENVKNKLKAEAD
jgi:hypothetical protein